MQSSGTRMDQRSGQGAPGLVCLAVAEALPGVWSEHHWLRTPAADRGTVSWH